MSQTLSEERQKVIDALNEARGLELNAITQYMNHHYNLAAMDYGDMAAKVKLIAIDEMRHAELFAERIEELGGQPTTAPSGKAVKGLDVNELFSSDRNLEAGAIDAYNRFLSICRENGDSTSAKLFETVIDEEQIHYNYFEIVVDHIAKLGDSYLAQIAGTPSATGIQYQGFVSRQTGAQQDG